MSKPVTSMVLRVVRWTMVFAVAFVSLWILGLALFGAVLAFNDTRGLIEFLVSLDVLLPLTTIASGVLLVSIWRTQRTALWASLAMTMLASPVVAIGLSQSVINPAPPPFGFATLDDVKARNDLPLRALFNPTEEEWEAMNARTGSFWMIVAVALLGQLVTTGILVRSPRR